MMRNFDYWYLVLMLCLENIYQYKTGFCFLGMISCAGLLTQYFLLKSNFKTGLVLRAYKQLIKHTYSKLVESWKCLQY